LVPIHVIGADLQEWVEEQELVVVASIVDAAVQGLLAQ